VTRGGKKRKVVLKRKGWNREGVVLESKARIFGEGKTHMLGGRGLRGLQVFPRAFERKYQPGSFERKVRKLGGKGRRA